MCTALALLWLGYVPAAGTVVHVKASQVRQLTRGQIKTAKDCAREKRVRLRIDARR